MTYISLSSLKTYQLARELEKVSWEMFTQLSFEGKKVVGFQFMDATDSVGANIAEGYGRFHYLDKKKFYYNARASLLESRHWIELIIERKLIQNETTTTSYFTIYKKLRLALTGLINHTKDTKS
jgi:four helix bundle protein